MGHQTSRFTVRRRTLWGSIAIVIVSMLILVACGESTASSSTPTPTATTAPPTATTAPAVASTDVVIIQMMEKPEGHYFFQPDAITIKAGTTVVWLDSTDAPHTVTSDPGAPTTFNTTTNVTQGKTFALTFNTAGTYPYHCNIHAGMKATITVTS